jgi:hypothetical protein
MPSCCVLFLLPLLRLLILLLQKVLLELSLLPAVVLAQQITHVVSIHAAGLCGAVTAACSAHGSSCCNTAALHVSGLLTPVRTTNGCEWQQQWQCVLSSSTNEHQHSKGHLIDPAVPASICININLRDAIHDFHGAIVLHVLPFASGSKALLRSNLCYPTAAPCCTLAVHSTL